MFQCGDHATKPVSTKMASTIPTTLCPLLRLTLSQRASWGETVWMIVPGIIELEGKPEIGWLQWCRFTVYIYISYIIWPITEISGYTWYMPVLPITTYQWYDPHSMSPSFLVQIPKCVWWLLLFGNSDATHQVPETWKVDGSYLQARVAALRWQRNNSWIMDMNGIL